MLRNIAFLILTLFVLTNCTSNKNIDDNRDADIDAAIDFMEDEEWESADEAEGEWSDEETPEDEFADSQLDDDFVEELNEESSDSQLAESDSIGDDESVPPPGDLTDTGSGVDELDGYNGQEDLDSLSQEEFLEDVNTGESEVVEEESTLEEEVVDEEIASIPQRTWVPVKKVAVEPFHKRGILVNAVYLVRHGDDIASVSTKIYGTPNRSDELLKVNSTLHKGLKTGDKVYYNSPQRPNDSHQFRLYYEDLNIPPQIYISRSGDNIRTVSKNLLGDKGSWKEIWATNLHVESKGQIPEGTELKYWISDMSVSQPMAFNEPEEDIPQEEMPPFEQESVQVQQPPPSESNLDQQVETLPTVGSVDNELPPVSKSGMETAQLPTVPSPPEPINAAPPVPPPPPEPVNAVPPVPPPPEPVNAELPPIPPVVEKKEVTKPAAATDTSQQLEWILGGILIFIGAILVFIIIRKKRRTSSQDFDYNTSVTSSNYQPPEG